MSLRIFLCQIYDFAYICPVQDEAVPSAFVLFYFGNEFIITDYL